MHLKPLRTQIERLEECDYLQLPLRFPAVLHIVCLIWANSTHYRRPAKLVVLLQEVSNLVIDLVCHCKCLQITPIASNTSMPCANFTVDSDNETRYEDRQSRLSRHT